jgi:hypothetical protein
LWVFGWASVSSRKDLMMSGKGRMTNNDEISVTIVPLLRASGTPKQEGKGSKTKGLLLRFMLGTPGNF